MCLMVPLQHVDLLSRKLMVLDQLGQCLSGTHQLPFHSLNAEYLPAAAV